MSAKMFLNRSDRQLGSDLFKNKNPLYLFRITTSHHLNYLFKCNFITKTSKTQSIRKIIWILNQTIALDDCVQWRHDTIRTILMKKKKNAIKEYYWDVVLAVFYIFNTTRKRNKKIKHLGKPSLSTNISNI